MQDISVMCFDHHSLLFDLIKKIVSEEYNYDIIINTVKYLIYCGL